MSNRCWECSKTAEFPIEIIFRLHYRAEINHILIASKDNKNIPKIEFHVGDGLAGSFLDVEYRFAGY